MGVTTRQQARMGIAERPETRAARPRKRATRQRQRKPEFFGFKYLPVEIQLIILDFVASSAYWYRPSYWPPYPGRDFPPLLALSLTNKAFRDFAIPILYGDIFLPFVDISSPHRPETTLLARTLRENPSLGAHCHHLDVNIRYLHDSSDGTEVYSNSLQTITDCMSNLRSLQLDGDFCSELEDDACEWLRGCLARMEALQHLSLSPQTLSLYVIRLLYNLQSRSLRRLTLSALSGLKELEESFRELQSSDPFYRSEIPESQVCELIIGACRTTMQPLHTFLNWPIRLETFSIDRILDYHYETVILNSSIIVGLLYKHRHSLRTLSFGKFSNRGRSEVPHEEPLDLSGFSALEELSLTRAPRWNDQEPVGMRRELANEILTAPNLLRFKWVLGGRVMAPQNYRGGLAKEETDWLRALATMAVASCHTLASIQVHVEGCIRPVRRIRPIRPITLVVGEEPERHPSEYSSWAYLEELRDEFAPQGVRITYSGARFTL